MTTAVSVYPANNQVRVTIKEPGCETTEVLEAGSHHRMFHVFGDRVIEISELHGIKVKVADAPDA